MKNVVYPAGTVAWLIAKTSVLNPIEKKWRITIDGASYNGKGMLVCALFLWKGRKCNMTPYGEVMHNGNLIAESMMIRLSAKYLREQYIEGLCRQACDPSTERYWAM